MLSGIILLSKLYLKSALHPQFLFRNESTHMAGFNTEKKTIYLLLLLYPRNPLS